MYEYCKDKLYKFNIIKQNLKIDIFLRINTESNMELPIST